MPKWATWEHFTELEKGFDDVWSDDSRFLDIHWFSGYRSGTYETYAAAADKHFGGTLKGVNVTAGLGAWAGSAFGHHHE